MSRGRITDPPDRRILGDAAVDRLGAGVIALARELWVVIDRMTALEAVLERHGIPAAEIDALQPDERMAAQLHARREQLLDNLLAAMGAGDERA